MELLIATLIHLVVPLAGLLLFLRLKHQMYQQQIPDPPITVLFLVFVTYGGWLMVILTGLFWQMSGMVTVGLAYLLLVAPLLMPVLAWCLYPARAKSKFHFGLFAACAAYLAIPIGVFVFQRVMIAKFGP
jgi:hypothetical protein